MHRISIRRHLNSAISSLLFIAGCTDRSAPDFPFDPTLPDRLLASASVIAGEPQDGDSTGASVFALVRDARMSPSGDRVVVLDVAPPYVRVFDRHGGLIRAFVSRGEGPGETRTASMIAVDASGRILMKDALRLTLFDPEGEVIVTRSLSDIHVIAMTSGCDGQWVFYGPERQSSNRHVGWVHTLRLHSDGSEELNTIYYDEPQFSRAHTSGPNYGLTATDSTIHIAHKFAKTPTTLELSCDGRVLGSTETPRLGPDEDVYLNRGDNLESASFRLDAPLLAGHLVHGNERIWAGWLTTNIETWDKATRFVYYDGDEPARVQLPGGFQLHDSHAGWALIQQMDPIPRLHIINIDTLFHTLRRATR